MKILNRPMVCIIITTISTYKTSTSLQHVSCRSTLQQQLSCHVVTYFKQYICLPSFANTIPTVRVFIFDRNVITNVFWKSTPEIVCYLHFSFETCTQSRGNQAIKINTQKHTRLIYKLMHFNAKLCDMQIGQLKHFVSLMHSEVLELFQIFQLYQGFC